MRKFNFYPGPSTIAASVLERMRDEFLEFGDAGAAFFELSHRSGTVVDCQRRIVARLREMLAVGDDYHVLLLHGGAIGQAAAIPMNLLRGHQRAAYAITGHWGKLAAGHAEAHCQVVRCTDTFPQCTSIPPADQWQVPDDCAYVHFTDNETIHGVEFQQIPDLEGQLLVADQSSNILSRPWRTDRVALTYACLQKNIGPSGMAVVAVRKELCGQELPITPAIWNYARQAKSDSMANTPATIQLRMLELVLDWTAEQGGPEEFGRRNRAKADRLYDFIDGSGFYANNVDPAVRSRMNVPFVLADDSLDDRFVSQSEEAGLIGLRGHRAVGGMRASIYNAMPEQGVSELIAFMQDFAARNG